MTTALPTHLVLLCICLAPPSYLFVLLLCVRRTTATISTMALRVRFQSVPSHCSSLGSVSGIPLVFIVLMEAGPSMDGCSKNPLKHFCGPQACTILQSPVLSWPGPYWSTGGRAA